MARIRCITNSAVTSAMRAAAARVLVLFLLVQRWGDWNSFHRPGNRLSSGTFVMAENDFSTPSGYLKEQEHQQRLQQFRVPIDDASSASESESVSGRFGRRLQSASVAVTALDHEARINAELKHQERLFQSSLQLPTDHSIPNENDLGHSQNDLSKVRRRLQSWSSAISWWGNEFNVLSFGAKGDGSTEDTKAFEGAWRMACSVAGSVIQVPAGHVFLVGPILFLGPCQPNIAFQVDGKILAIGSTAREWAESDVKNNYWLQFKGLVGLQIRGKGIIDGNGATWWNQQCKKTKNGSSRCKSPTAVKIYRSTNVVVSGITIANSPQIHIRVDTCSHVLVTGVKVSAPADTANTDGFYFDNTHQAILQYSSASTGDDCVGIQSGSSNILIQHFKCGPGHGISIGSLGEKGTTACVSNIHVRDVTVENAEGAVRIKSWQGGSGTVSGITFEDVKVKNVKNPVVIDQYYCDSGKAADCRNSSTKAVAITDVKFRNIQGTYSASGGKAVYIACSDVVPCTGLSMINVNLWPTSGAKIRYRKNFLGGSFCWKGYGFVDGYSSTVGLKQCIQPQPNSRFWSSALANCQHACYHS